MTTEPPPKLTPKPATEPSRARRVALFGLWCAGLAGALLLQGVSSSSEAPAALDAAPAVVLAPRTARVAREHVRPGEAVKADTPILELDPAEVDLEIALGRVELERLNTEVLAQVLEVQGSDFEAGARLEIEAERAALELRSLLAEEKRNRAELEALDTQIARQNDLVERKLASSEQRDELLLRRAATAERVGEAAGSVAAARAREEAARKRLKEWRTTHKVPEDERTAPRRAAVRAQEERLKQLELRRAAMTVRAPVDGVLSELLVPVGGTARESEPLFVVTPQSASHATAWVDEAGASRVHVGDRVELRPLDGDGGLRTGRVRALGAGVVEIPRRFWPLTGEPVFGRAVFVDLDPGPASIPGQRMEARFSR